MDRHERTSQHEGRSCGASKCAHRQGACRSGVENAVQRAWRNALAELAGRDQGIPRQRGSAAVADHEGGRDQAGVNGLRAKDWTALASDCSGSTNHEYPAREQFPAGSNAGIVIRTLSKKTNLSLNSF